MKDKEKEKERRKDAYCRRILYHCRWCEAGSSANRVCLHGSRHRRECERECERREIDRAVTINGCNQATLHISLWATQQWLAQVWNRQ